MDWRISRFVVYFACLKLSLQAALPSAKNSSDHEYMAVTVCKGGRRTIACPQLQLLHIFTAFYGKMSGQDCEEPMVSPRSQIPTCSSKKAGQIIRDECHGQQSCDLYSEDSMYDNPCPEVLKYLFVSYTCQGKTDVLGKLRSIESTNNAMKPLTRPVLAMPMPQRENTPMGLLSAPFVNKAPQTPDIRTLSVCNGKAGTIVCPDLRIIRIHGAFFGLQNGRDCLGRLTRDNIPTCFAPYAISTVRDICQGQQSCDLYTEPSLYGRSSCPATEKKYLSVAYSCIGHSFVEKNLQLLSQRGRAGFNAPYPAQWAATSFHPAYGPYQKQPWSQQAAVRNMPARPYPRYPYAPKPNPNFYQRPVVRQIMQSPYQPAQYNPAMNQQYNTFNAFTTSPSCDLCNGDCNNWSCFGCGGCETPQMVQQTYMYPYQRQDAAFHDSFAGHEMALSGMVVWPVPKMPKALKKLNPPKTRSETYEEEADDGMASGDGSGDDEDDEDDTR